MPVGVPYPGIIDGRARRNFDALQYVNPYNIIYFIFDYRTAKANKVIVELPINSIIYAPIIIKILEPFDGVQTRLEVGTNDSPTSIGVINVNTKSIRFLETLNSTKFMDIMTVVTKIRIGITVTTATAAPTQGNGWGLLQYINLSQVSSFQKV